MSAGILDEWVRILHSLYDSQVVAKQCLIPPIILQFFPMLSVPAQKSFIEIYHDLYLQGAPLVKRKICQSLHEAWFLSDEEVQTMLEQLIKDSNE